MNRGGGDPGATHPAKAAKTVKASAETKAPSNGAALGLTHLGL